MSNVYILGAGFSNAIHAAMPLLGELTEQVWSRARELLTGNQEPPFRDNIELLLSYLAQNHPWLSEAKNLRNTAAFLDLAAEVGQRITAAEKQALADPCPEWLATLVRRWYNAQSAVITLNYDTLAERAAQTALKGGGVRFDVDAIYGVPLTLAAQRITTMITGTGEPSLHLYKLHGSANWFYSGRSEYGGEQIYLVGTYCGWSNQRESESTGFQDPVVDKVPLIVPPAADKAALFEHETVRALWALSGKALQKADAVYCLGYSLPVTDLTMHMLLVTNAPTPKVPFYPVNTDPTAADHFRTLLDAHYDIRPDFIRADNPIPAFVDTHCGPPDA